MYKLISVCLALSFVFSETNTIKNKSVEKLEQTELKKAKSSTELEVAASKLLESKSLAVSKESQKREKNSFNERPNKKGWNHCTWSGRRKSSENISCREFAAFR